MSRTGAASEIFRGPLWYGVVHSLGCLLFWTDHPAGAIAIIILCVGDGYVQPFIYHRYLSLSVLSKCFRKAQSPLISSYMHIAYDDLYILHSTLCLHFYSPHRVADIVGRRFGRNNPLPLNRQKSYAGSLAFIVCSLTVLTLFIPFMSRVFNPIPTKSSASIPSTLSTSSPWDVSFLKLSLITLISAIVEALPVEIDNITVFSAAALSAYLLI